MPSRGATPRTRGRLKLEPARCRRTSLMDRTPGAGRHVYFSGGIFSARRTIWSSATLSSARYSALKPVPFGATCALTDAAAAKPKAVQKLVAIARRINILPMLLSKPLGRTFSPRENAREEAGILPYDAGFVDVELHHEVAIQTFEQVMVWSAASVCLSSSQHFSVQRGDIGDFDLAPLAELEIEPTDCERVCERTWPEVHVEASIQ